MVSWEDFSNRIHLVSGKGGVGRTSFAASLAKWAVSQGKKTLVCEIEDESDWNSPLAQRFGFRRFSTEAPDEIRENLFGLTLSAKMGQEKFLTSFLKISALSEKVIQTKGVRWFLDGAPAFREMGFFYHLLTEMRLDYDTIIIDLPATGHLVGLARLPQILLKLVPIGPIAERLREGQTYFYNPEITRAWVVTLPQGLPVSEAIELAVELKKESISVGGFIVNRMPFNPFTPEEELKVEAYSKKSEQRQLLVELERLKRSREAFDRLKRTQMGKVFLLGEQLKEDSFESPWITTVKTLPSGSDQRA